MKKIILVCLVALFTVGAVSAQKPQKGEKKTVTVEFMTSLDCEGCAKKINDTLPYEKGVRDVKVDVPTKVVTVTYDPAKNTPEGLIPAFKTLKVGVVKHMTEEEFAKHKEHNHHGHSHSHAGHKH